MAVTLKKSETQSHRPAVSHSAGRIGHRTDDWNAANATGCRFIGVRDGTLGSAAYDRPILGD